MASNYDSMSDSLQKLNQANEQRKSGEEAMSIHFARLGIAPYLPNGTVSPCPSAARSIIPKATPSVGGVDLSAVVMSLFFRISS